MDSRQRVLRSIAHQEVDRTPSFYLGVEPITTALCTRLGVTAPAGMAREYALLDALGADVAYLMPTIRHVAGEERFSFSLGSVHARLVEGRQDVVIERAPLADATSIDDLDTCCWPNPDWFDYTVPRAASGALRGKAIVAYDMGIVCLAAMGMRGMEQLMLDMAGEPEMAHAIFTRIADFNYERAHRLLEANPGIIDILGIGDDVAGQRGLFFKLDMWRTFLKPHLQRMVDLCHQHRVVPYFHGCGGFSELYRDFVAMGITCTGRLQTEAKGNEFTAIKRGNGRELCLWGAIDGQHIAVNGTVAEVRAHVRELLAIGSPGSGYIAGPTHSFTSDTPIDNILAIYHELGT